MDSCRPVIEIPLFSERALRQEWKTLSLFSFLLSSLAQLHIASATTFKNKYYMAAVIWAYQSLPSITILQLTPINHSQCLRRRFTSTCLQIQRDQITSLRFPFPWQSAICKHFQHQLPFLAAKTDSALIGLHRKRIIKVLGSSQNFWEGLGTRLGCCRSRNNPDKTLKHIPDGHWCPLCDTSATWF